MSSCILLKHICSQLLFFTEVSSTVWAIRVPGLMQAHEYGSKSEQMFFHAFSIYAFKLQHTKSCWRHDFVALLQCIIHGFRKLISLIDGRCSRSHELLLMPSRLRIVNISLTIDLAVQSTKETQIKSIYWVGAKCKSNSSPIRPTRQEITYKHV